MALEGSERRRQGKVAVVTGSNSGVGLAIVEELLAWEANITVVFACRNITRAQEAIDDTLKKFPGSCLIFIELNTSSVASVMNASIALKQQFEKIDYLFLNAGILPISRVNMRALMKLKSVTELFTTGGDVLEQVQGELTTEGMGSVFATNVFGHYVLFHELLSIFSGDTRIIWTSSTTASKKFFSRNDVQHLKGSKPYESSKYIVDALSYAINLKYNAQGIFSFTTCPGCVLSGLTYNLLPKPVWILALPILFLLRWFLPNLTLFPNNGAEAMVWLAKQKTVKDLPSNHKYYSHIAITGRLSVHHSSLNMTAEEALFLYNELETLRQRCPNGSEGPPVDTRN